MKVYLSLTLAALSFSLPGFSLAAPLGVQPAIDAAPVSSAIDVIRNRYILSVLPRRPSDVEHLKTQGAKYADMLQPDGTWPDINYQGAQRANWSAAEHLNRTLVMAKAARLYRNAGQPDDVLDAKVASALQAWTEKDYRNPNWWWNEIGVPELTGEIASLMWPQLRNDEVQRVVEIMKRSNWRRVPWTGANLTWGVVIEIVRGCLENNSDAVAEGYNRMYQEIRIVSPTEEGIQQDDSFHQHGAQLYNGGYGLNYADDVGRFIAFAWGTRFQIPPDRMAIFSSYLLDGEQWLIRGDVIDYSTIGREITRQGKVIAPGDWSNGPVSPAGPAYSLENVVAMLAAESMPRQGEFESFAARLRGESAAPAFTGNKQFWCSDFMAHRRKSFYTSVKMLSDRMLNGEQVNGEGKKSEHLSDGVNLLYLTGDEYKDIFPVWDWTKVPGTTVIQGTLQKGETNSVGARGKNSFAGGVSDGVYGMAAMDFIRGKLSAKKAWFFFDDSYLCLGASISLSDDSDHGVVTDVNQLRLTGDVFTNQSPQPLPAGMHTYAPGKATWVYHGHVGYVFGPDSKVSLSIGPQSGSWSDIGTGSSALVTLPIFDLWIDHGHSPHGGTYQYLVLPNASAKEVAARASNPVIQVLANNEDIQAVYNSNLRLLMAAFHKPSSLMTPLGRVEVDHASLLLIRRFNDGWRITASNPENEPLTLTASVPDHDAQIQLPGGNFAGSSVTVRVFDRRKR